MSPTDPGGASRPADRSPAVAHTSADRPPPKAGPRSTGANWVRIAIVIALAAALWAISWTATHAPIDELIR